MVETHSVLECRLDRVVRGDCGCGLCRFGGQGRISERGGVRGFLGTVVGGNIARHWDRFWFTQSTRHLMDDRFG
jgi:hypothetical protein